MPRINQLPVASSVAQTDVLAIDTPNKTYQVPRSVLAPSPYIAIIPTGQWSGSGSDYYITVTASNVTADSILYPFFDSESEALLNGLVWAVPASGSFTIHTSAIPSGTVTISVLLAGVVGEAQYQVLSDVYSKSQAVAKADIVDNLTSTNTDKPLSAAQGKALNEAIAQSTAYSVSDLTCDTSIAAPSDLRIIRYGKLRIITGGITPAISQGTWNTLLTLQESDRPTVSILAPLYGYNASSTAEAVLRPTGNFQVNFAAGTSTSATLKINMTYVVA